MRKKVKKTDKNLIGAAGEHLVLSRLLQKGYLAALVPMRTERIDILVNHQGSKPPCLIQVKTKTERARGWLLDSKNERNRAADTFYCFVDFAKEQPDIYVIPARKVARVIKKAHQTWLGQPGKRKQKRNDSNMRKVANSLPGIREGWMNEYLEAWDLILEKK